MGSKQDYHKIAVYVLQQEKMSLLALNNIKYAFKVIPVRPMNAPEFYTCMMQDFYSEWDLLFTLTIFNTTEIGAEPVHVTDTNGIYIGNIKTYSGIKGIIKYILA